MELLPHSMEAPKQHSMAVLPHPVSRSLVPVQIRYLTQEASA